MTFALLFPGQGTQYAGMLPWLEDRAEASQVLGLVATALGDNWRTKLEDAQWSSSNAVAQPLLVGLSLASWRCLAPLVPQPKMVAGYSVGELAAYCAAGVFEAKQAMSIAADRSHFMDRSVAGVQTTLFALHGAGLPHVGKICMAHELEVAIEASDDMVVLGGEADRIEAAEPELRAAGFGITRLGVNVASHTSWMRQAAMLLSRYLEQYKVQAPSLPVVSNLTGAATRSASELRFNLALQVCNTVRWTACMDTLAESGMRCALEVGPGTSLSKLLRMRHPGIDVRSADEFRSPEACARWVRARAST